MSHFNMTYEGSSFSPTILSCELSLCEADGSWKGQEPGEAVTFYLSLQAEPFEYDVPEDEDEHLSMTPGVDTQWLELPTTIFASRHLRDLDGLTINYEGPQTINPLTGEEWRDPPGLLGVYVDEAFGKARIDITACGGSAYALHLVGETESRTLFDVKCEAPLTVKLTSYTGQPGEDRLRRWFDGFLRWDDFVWQRSVTDREDGTSQHDLVGTLKA